MTEFTDAKQAAKLLRSFLKVCDQIESVSSIDELTAQANTRLTLAKRDLAGVEKEIAAAEARKAEAKAKAAEDEGEAQRQIIKVQGVLNDLTGKINAARGELSKVETARQELRSKIGWAVGPVA